VVVRTISDRADHDAHLDFPIFVDQIASHFTCGVVKRLLEIL
ncbi:MAG TPA: 5'-methylthioadenosine/adenosylhomocysteine nucleosidase, partial [Saprospirales bacterium]|nr:5'-methylthioadenosine/adenosylhomocysteine nucleosidase [Saprospirales bacterium]